MSRGQSGSCATFPLNFVKIGWVVSALFRWDHNFLIDSLSLSLRFNGHFPGGPGLASTRMSPFWISMKQDDWGGGDNWSYKMCKAPAKLSPSANQHPVFLQSGSFLSPNQQRQSTEGNLDWFAISYKTFIRSFIQSLGCHKYAFWGPFQFLE